MRPTSWRAPARSDGMTPADPVGVIITDAAAAAAAYSADAAVADASEMTRKKQTEIILMVLSDPHA